MLAGIQRRVITLSVVIFHFMIISQVQATHIEPADQKNLIEIFLNNHPQETTDNLSQERRPIFKNFIKLLLDVKTSTDRSRTKLHQLETKWAQHKKTLSKIDYITLIEYTELASQVRFHIQSKESIGDHFFSPLYRDILNFLKEFMAKNANYVIYDAQTRILQGLTLPRVKTLYTEIKKLKEELKKDITQKYAITEAFAQFMDLNETLLVGIIKIIKSNFTDGNKIAHIFDNGNLYIILKEHIPWKRTGMDLTGPRLTPYLETELIVHENVIIDLENYLPELESRKSMIAETLRKGKNVRVIGHGLHGSSAELFALKYNYESKEKRKIQSISFNPYGFLENSTKQRIIFNKFLEGNNLRFFYEKILKKDEETLSYSFPNCTNSYGQIIPIAETYTFESKASRLSTYYDIDFIQESVKENSFFAHQYLDIKLYHTSIVEKALFSSHLESINLAILNSNVKINGCKITPEFVYFIWGDETILNDKYIQYLTDGDLKNKIITLQAKEKIQQQILEQLENSPDFLETIKTILFNYENVNLFRQNLIKFVNLDFSHLASIVHSLDSLGQHGLSNKSKNFQFLQDYYRGLFEKLNLGEKSENDIHFENEDGSISSQLLPLLQIKNPIEITQVELNSYIEIINKEKEGFNVLAKKQKYIRKLEKLLAYQYKSPKNHHIFYTFMSEHSGKKAADNFVLKMAKAQLAWAIDPKAAKSAGQGETGTLLLRENDGNNYDLAVFKGQGRNTFLKQQFGQVAYLNQEDNLFQANNEIAAYIISEVLNFGVSPIAAPIEFMKNGQLTQGTLIQFLKGYREGTIDDFSLDRYTTKKATAFQKLALFDILIGNLDRHTDNLWISLEDGILDLKAIDNANAFPIQRPIGPATHNMYAWKNYNIAKYRLTNETIDFFHREVNEEGLNKAIEIVNQILPNTFQEKNIEGVFQRFKFLKNSFEGNPNSIKLSDLAEQAANIKF